MPFSWIWQNHLTWSIITFLLKNSKLSLELSLATVHWFTSYLLDRFQKVNISSILSEPKEVVAGVPQGSVLVPLLFILYSNDPSLLIHDSNTNMFADDYYHIILHMVKHLLKFRLKSKINFSKFNDTLAQKTKTMLTSANKHPWK